MDQILDWYLETIYLEECILILSSIKYPAYKLPSHSGYTYDASILSSISCRPLLKAGSPSCKTNCSRDSKVS